MHLLLSDKYQSSCFAFHELSHRFEWIRNRRYNHHLAASSLTLNAKLQVHRGDEVFAMSYTLIERKDSAKLPVVVLHGGPGLPSDYLRPLQDIITDRTLLFYDQLGCGASDTPKEATSKYYSMDLLVDDLIHLLDIVRFPSFHLYGQSFGGDLAFEYLKKVE
jgi:pimeloyl-ACP methyl ester carboxylesterase